MAESAGVAEGEGGREAGALPVVQTEAAAVALLATEASEVDEPKSKVGLPRPLPLYTLLPEALPHEVDVGCVERETEEHCDSESQALPVINGELDKVGTPVAHALPDGDAHPLSCALGVEDAAKEPLAAALVVAA